MNLPSYANVIAKVQNDVDLNQEGFITPTEMLGYLNEAIRQAAKVVNTMGIEDKYFMAPPTTITLVIGQASYNLPADIYGYKIRKLWYINGSRKYEITKIRDINQIPFINTSDDYQFQIYNPAGGPPQLWLYPTPQEAGPVGTLWYIRNPVVMDMSATSTNVMEIPESEDFIYQHMKWNCAKKTKVQSLIDAEWKDVLVQKQLMEEALAEVVADANNKAIADLSSYHAQEVCAFD